jgi:ketosteroid isomerase-like protein
MSTVVNKPQWLVLTRACMTLTPDRSRAVVQRLCDAGNRHDLTALVECFAPDYVSEQPNHPDRAFRGREQVRKNWAAIFESMPDLRLELRGTAVDGETAWTEWHWTGTQRDGAPFDWHGVLILGVYQDVIGWARLYMEPTDSKAEDIDETVRAMTGRADEPA